MSNWQDRIVGVRMNVDQEFSDRVVQSQFSRQQWGLIMTAVEFEIENADDDEDARIVADTSRLPAIMPELDNIQQQMNAAGMGGGGGRQGGGLVDSIKGALGLGGGKERDEERTRAAEALAQEYAAELQATLEANGRWDEIRAAAQ